MWKTPYISMYSSYREDNGSYTHRSLSLSGRDLTPDLSLSYLLVIYPCLGLWWGLPCALWWVRPTHWGYSQEWGQTPLPACNKAPLSFFGIPPTIWALQSNVLRMPSANEKFGRVTSRGWIQVWWVLERVPLVANSARQVVVRQVQQGNLVAASLVESVSIDRSGL